MKLDQSKINKLRQAGFFAKGSVYVMVGALAAMSAAGLGGDIEGRSGAVDFLMELPLGQILVAIISLGLLAFSLWRFYQVVYDPNGNGEKSRAGARTRYAYSALLYLFIAYSFAKPLLSNGNGSEGGDQKKAALSEMLQESWGVWLIVGIAVLVALQAAWQFYLGYSGRYMGKIDNEPSNAKEYELVKRAGTFGYMARGVVFGIFSFFLVKVVLDHNADEYEGTEGAFQYLLSFDYGRILMGAVALGLLGYGVFCMMVARHSSKLSRVD